MIKRRKMGMQVLLAIITLGIYVIYWFYVTSKEMIEYKKLTGSPGLWTFLLFVPFGGVGGHRGFRELTRHVLKGALLLRELEIHGSHSSDGIG